MAVNCLPMMNPLTGVFSDEIGFNFFNCSLYRQCSAFEERLPQPNNASDRVNFQKQPSRFNKEGLQFCNFYFSIDTHVVQYGSIRRTAMPIIDTVAAPTAD